MEIIYLSAVLGTLVDSNSVCNLQLLNLKIVVNLSLNSTSEKALIEAICRTLSDSKEPEEIVPAVRSQLAEIGRCTAEIVHEIRSPLTTISLAIAAFEELDLSPVMKQRLSLAREEARRLERLLNEVLNYAQPTRLVPEAVELNQFIGEILPLLQLVPEGVGKSIEFKSSVSKLWINGDRDKLRQVCLNLVKNAYEAIPQGSVVTCQLERKAGDRAILCFHNGGKTIPPHLLATITQPFVSDKTNGSGLGLTISQQIVATHGGELTIKSAPATGTTVCIALPCLSS